MDSHGMPCSASLAATSERLTALMPAPGMTSATASPPGSSLRRARRAEASRMTLLTPRFPSAVCDQLVRQHPPFRHVLPDQGLGAADRLLRSQDSDVVVSEDQHEIIPCFHAQSLSVFRGNDEPATFAEFCQKPSHMPPRRNSTKSSPPPLQKPPAPVRHRADLAERSAAPADLLAVPPQELVGGDQPRVVLGELRRHGLGGRAVHPGVVGFIPLAETEPDEDAQHVRVRAERPLRPREKEDLVRAGLADAGEALEELSGLLRVRPDQLP